jgi:hypothetical protein
MFFLATILTLSLAGCSQDTPAEQAEEEAGVDEIVEEETTAPYQAPSRDAEEAADEEAKKKAAEQGKGAFGQQSSQEKARNTIAAYEAGGQVDGVTCQIAKAQLDLGEEGAANLLNGWDSVGDGPSVRELQAQGMDPQEAMRGARDLRARLGASSSGRGSGVVVTPE